MNGSFPPGLAVLLFALLIAIVTGGVWIRNRLQAKVNQKVFQRREYQEGLVLTSTELRFEVNADAADTQAAIRDTIVAREQVPMTPDLYVSSERPGELSYEYGSKFGRIFLATISISQRGSGCTVRQVFPNWTEADGVTAGVSTMKRLQHDLCLGVAKADSAARPQTKPLVSSGDGNA